VRVAGDFYEFLRVGPSRVLFGLLDLAGRREDTREILIATQNTFRIRAPKLFAGRDFNEAEAMIELCYEINRTILQFAEGIRSCPAFIGCYNEDRPPTRIAGIGRAERLVVTPVEEACIGPRLSNALKSLDRDFAKGCTRS